MARARNIKPGFFKNEVLGQMSPLTRILFEGLWCLADKEGRLEDRPMRIKIEILPYDDWDVDAALTSLHEACLIQRYAVDESRFIQVSKWKKHQNPHHKEADSEIPPPEQGVALARAKHESSKSQASVNKNASCPTDSLNLIPDSLNSDSLGEEGAAPENVPRGTPHPDDESDDPASPASQPPPDDDERDPLDEAFIHIPLNDGSEHPVTYRQKAEWQGLYPAVDVEQSLRGIRGWNLANPQNRKTQRGVTKHITNWLARDQDKAPSLGANYARRNQSHDRSAVGRNLAGIEEYFEQQRARGIDVD